MEHDQLLRSRPVSRPREPNGRSDRRNESVREQKVEASRRGTGVTKRARRGIAGSVLVVLGLVIGAVVVTALQAEGRERSEANTNDGGAWLLKRDVGYVGHVNRVVGEITAAVSTSEPGSDYDIDQANGVIVVHDRTAGTLGLVDDRTSTVLERLQVDPDVTVHAVDGGALVVKRDSLGVWKLSRDALASLESLDELEPILRGEGAALSAATPDGHAVIVDQGADNVIFLRPDGSTDTSPKLNLTDDAVSLTFLGEDTAVLADPDGDVFVATPDQVTSLDTGVTDSESRPAPLILQQPGGEADHVVAATADGRLFAIPLATGEGERVESTEIGQLTGGSPVAPLVFGGCLFAVSTAPATFTQWCGDQTVESTPLEGAGSELRLRLVNGWVWVNDVDTGAAWVTSPQRRLDRVEDWGAILAQSADETDENDTENEGGEVIEEINPDDPNAEIVESDEIDELGPNRPPVARDDQTQTRVDRPIDVDVLANDTDPNGDVLLVTEINPTGGDAVIAINPDARGVQVSPAAGYAGVVTFGYTISDGRGESASAVVTVEVTASNGAGNRPPEAHADIASTRKGRSTTFDVVANDVDPDGDALVLESIALSDPAATAGTIVSDPSGRVVFTPDVNSRSDRIELTYVVSDDFAATAEGKVVVSVRLKDANNEPDARNDAGVTVVGKPVRLDVLHNDTDPDNDPLFIAQLPTLVRPENQTTESLDLSLTPDGEFFFNPTTAGTYAFNYSATDGEESDVAQIRVEVTEPSSNRPPTAVRDDVVIPAGGSRLVYVLANDGDPDGDIVALVGHTTDTGLTVKEVDGVGYLVTVAPDAPKRPTFRYQISDGTSNPVTAVVVVAVTDSKIIDQPPVARTDVVEVRAGGRVAVPVLVNDFDPEGGALEVASVTTNPAAESTPGLNGQTVDIDVRPDVISSFTLSYTVADEGGNQASAFLEVRIVPADEVNRPPIARTDVARTRSGVPIAVEVVANDSDPDGDIIAVQNIRSQPGGGTARVDNGAIVYTPSETFSGTDRFSYALVDANGEIAIGEVLVGVMPLAAQNRAPEAFDDTIEVVAGSAPLILDVLDNDSDPDGDRILVTQVGAPSSGETAMVEGGGAVEFTPPARTGTADGGPAELAFNYSIDDGRGGTASATVEVIVIPSTDAVAPIAVDDQVGPVGPGQTVQIDLLANDLDPDGNPAELTVSSSDPALAQLDGGTLTFTAGAHSSRHRYTVTDPAGLSDTSELAVLVVSNRAPTVEPLEVETSANEPLAIDLAAQASDPDGDPLYFVCCDGQRGGTARTSVNGPNELTVQFNPDDRFAGRATFSYTADDQKGHIVAGSVTVNVLPPSNRPPTAADANLEVQAGRATNVDLAALVKDPDPGETFQFTTTPPSDGVVQLRPDGATVRATAAIDQAGRTDSFQYTVIDSGGESATATVNLTVAAPDAPPPQARPDSATTNQATPVTVAVLANDIDPLGQGLTVSSVGASNAGTATTDGRRVTFSPSSDFFGTTTFQYRIRDGSSIAQREAEAQVTVNVIGHPSAPGSPTAVAGNATATVNWAAPAANGAPVDDYEIRIGEGGGRSIGNTTGFTWTGLTNGDGVQFSVRAHNVAGWGPWSGPSPVVTPDIEPGRPAAPTVEFADGALVVSWNPPANEGSTITNYDLQIGGGASAVQRVGAGTSFTWTGLQNGTEYTFLVRAVNAKGEGQWSSPSAPEHPLRAPSTPAAPVGQRGDRTILVSWTPPDNGGDSIIEYEVQIQSTGATNLTTATSLQWSNLPNGEPQSFTVRARNRGGWSPASAASVPVIPCTHPDQVPAVQAVRGDRAANVSWTAPNPQGCAITGYTITNSQGATMTVGGNVTSATFAGLTNGTPYTFTVVATNEEGNSPASAPSNPVTPAGPPFAPTITRAVPDVGRVYVEWAAANDNGSPIVRYELSVNGGAWENVGNVLSTTRGGLANGTNYTFQVRAVNDVNPGAPSNTVGARTPGEPGQVGGLSLNPGDAQISATWSAPPDNGKPITSYHLDIDPGGDPSSGDRSYVFSGLNNGQQYGIRVQACNAVGCGAWSGFQYATPRAPVHVNWSKGASAQGQPNCGSSYCRWINVSGSGLTPGRTYSVQCHSNDWGAVGSANNATANGNGDLSAGNVCYFGYPNDVFWVRLEPGGHESEHRTFGN
jgi:large repetitive protein